MELDPRVLIVSDHGFCAYDDAPVRTLPPRTSTGAAILGDHHPEAIWIKKGIAADLRRPTDVFNAIRASLDPAASPAP